jgi:hypothetical protein
LSKLVDLTFQEDKLKAAGATIIRSEKRRNLHPLLQPGAINTRAAERVGNAADPII